MLRSFSEELMEQREFEIGGQVFRIRYPHWREGALLFDEGLTPAENGDKQGEPAAFSFVADTEMAIKKIPLFIDDDYNDGHARFKELVNRKKDPVPRFLLVRLYTWLMQVTDGRPTEPPSPSAVGGGDTEALSADASSSPEVTPKQ
jgi:hypothetical protein